jgi:hypothetical protein
MGVKLAALQMAGSPIRPGHLRMVDCTEEEYTALDPRISGCLGQARPVTQPLKKC